MKIYSVSSANYSRKSVVKPQIQRNESLQTPQKTSNDVSFQGTKGGLLGILSGAAIGLTTAAVIVATGGAAAAIAAVGIPGVLAGGAAAGTHVGGIAGSIIEEKLNEDKKDK